MKKILGLSILLIITVVISGCSQISKTETTVDIVGTQVSRILTASATYESQKPVQTEAPLATNTLTIPESTPTSTMAPSQTPTETTTPTPTQDVNDPAAILGAPAWTQDFNGSSSPWDFDYTQALFETRDGYLYLTARANPNWHSWYVTSPKLKNAYVEALVDMPNCSGADRFGLAVRASSDGQQFYYLGITCDGQWGFFRMAEDVDIHEILSYRTSDQLTNGMNLPHRVGIWMKGTTFKFYINGKEVGSATDDTLTGEGYTGFIIAYANTNGYTVRVDELKYWNVP
jgi:hypothetical protein